MALLFKQTEIVIPISAELPARNGIVELSFDAFVDKKYVDNLIVELRNGNRHALAMNARRDGAEDRYNDWLVDSTPPDDEIVEKALVGWENFSDPLDDEIVDYNEQTKSQLMQQPVIVGVVALAIVTYAANPMAAIEKNSKGSSSGRSGGQHRVKRQTKN